jgi:hypothetical protein
MALHNPKNDIVSRVIAFAKSLGFSAERTKSGHIKFIRPGTPSVFFSGTPSDHRAYQNGIAKLRRVDRGVA